MVLLPGLRLLTVERHDRGQDAGYLLRGVELARLLARAGGELAYQVFVGVTEGVAVGGELRQTLGDLRDDRAELVVSVCVASAQLVRSEVDLREQALESAFKRFVLDVLEPRLQGVEQLLVLGAGHVRDAGPEVIGLDDVVRLATHLLFKLGDVFGVVRVPHGQRDAAVVTTGGDLGIVPPQFLLCGGLVVVREVAQEQERQHVVAEVVRIHRPAQLIGDVPERFAQLFLFLFGHSVVASAGSLGNNAGLKG